MTMPDNLPWLVGLLAFFLSTPTVVSAWAAKHFPGWTGAAARWWQARKLRVAAEDRLGRTEARLAALEADYEKQAAGYRQQIAVLQLQIDAQGRQLLAQAAEIGQLRDGQTKLEDDLTQANRRLWAAIGYIRKLGDALARHADVPEPPQELRDIL